MFSSDSDYDSNYSDDEEEGRYHEEEEEEEEGVERAEPTEIVDYEMDFDDLDEAEEAADVENAAAAGASETSKVVMGYPWTGRNRKNRVSIGKHRKIGL